MKLRAAPLVIAAFMIAGCATTRPVPKDEGAAAARGPTILTQAENLIATGSPASLAEGVRMAAVAEGIGADGAAGTGVVGRALLHGLYPDSGGSTPEAAAPGEPPLPRSPFLQRIAAGLVLLDPREQVDDAGAAALSEKLALAGAQLPDSPLPPFFQGLLVLKVSGPLADARARFEAALKRSPDFSPAAAGLSETIIRSGTAAAELPFLQKLASLQPTQPRRFAALARAELAAGRPDLASDAAAQGLLLAPDDPSFALLRARALADAGDWYQSLRVLDALVRLQPDLIEATLLQARLLHEKAQNDPAALAVLTDAEARFPAEAPFLELRARILFDQGSTIEAVAMLRRAHDLAPKSVSVLTLLASIAEQQQQWNEAADWLEQIPPASRTSEHLQLGWRIFTGLGDHAQAMSLASTLFEMTHDPKALALEARSMLAAERPADALIVIDHVLLAMNPSPAFASELHFLRSRAGSADPLLDLRSALREDPDNGEALSSIAEVLAGRKDYRKAMEYAKRASALAPEDAALAQRAAEMSKLAETGP